MAAYRRYDLSFFTATILEWKPILSGDEHKKIITDSLDYLVAPPMLVFFTNMLALERQ